MEFVKTKNSGQFSLFTAAPNVIRGGHHHHSKNEKFLVVKGIAKFSLRNIETSQLHEIVVSEDKDEVVEIPPGWSHSIQNIGADELFVFLWSNEVFNIEKPDTFSSAVNMT